MEVIANQSKLPDPQFAAAWESIKIDQGVRDRLLDSPGDTGGSLLSFIVGTTSTSDFVSHLIRPFYPIANKRMTAVWRRLRPEWVVSTHSSQ